MPRDRFAAMACSVARTANIVADPWTLVVLRDLFLGLTRFDQFTDDLGIATNTLTDRLTTLVDAGLVERRPYRERPVRHEYHLTEAGKDLYGVVVSLLAWGDRHLAPDGAPLRLRHTTCDHETTPVVSCSHCGGELHADDVVPLPGPGGRAAPGTRVIAELLTSRRGVGRSTD
ncbi:HxlR family transcriptional regulator [Saccharothrix carnea]|uniref:HxlR family transcriptional regulator n=1 Tax=Saccharothrix carnea TaxID=1280637 RepID=A0A2P8I124_SACCR|nr:helix-turn-helix domain-containing protein [Saccharothrix carnea]PSL52171.1 HxlR family transcriptional regulator [Saccharothrix carnea]